MGDISSENGILFLKWWKFIQKCTLMFQKELNLGTSMAHLVMYFVAEVDLQIRSRLIHTKMTNYLSCAKFIFFLKIQSMDMEIFTV